MDVLKIYEEDLKIKEALLNVEDKMLREKVTRDFFYRKCYPNFKYVYDNYFTDCTSVIEFISEIYKIVMTPGTKSGKPAMANFRGESSLTTWLQNISIKYCNKCFKKKQQMPVYEQIPFFEEKDNDSGGINESVFGSIDIDLGATNAEDVEKILRLMPNERYRAIIRLFYLEGETNDTVAEILGMSKANLYNKKILAEAQYIRVYRKEEQHG